MPSNSRFHRATTGPSASAVYTQLPNDSTSLLEPSTQVDYSQDGIAGNKPDPNRIDIDNRDDDENDEEDERRQDGVRQAEAITSSWTFRALVFTYGLYGLPWLEVNQRDTELTETVSTF